MVGDAPSRRKAAKQLQQSRKIIEEVAILLEVFDWPGQA
jgi:hypothetical protein